MHHHYLVWCIQSLSRQEKCRLSICRSLEGRFVHRIRRFKFYSNKQMELVMYIPEAMFARDEMAGEMRNIAVIDNTPAYRNA